METHTPPPRLDSAVQERSQTARELELAQWIEQAEAENAQLRRRLEALEAAPRQEHAPASQVAELQAWLNAAEDENARLREALATAKPERIDSSDEAQYLRERLSEAEAALHAARGLAARLAQHVEQVGARDLERLKSELSDARQTADAKRINELEQALARAEASLATITAETVAVSEGPRRALSVDDVEKQKALQAQQIELAAKDRRLQDLEAELKGQEEDLAGFRQRISAWERRDEALQEQIETLRCRAAGAEEKLGAVTAQLEAAQNREADKEASLETMVRKLQQADERLQHAEAEIVDLRRQLETQRMAHTTRETAVVEHADIRRPLDLPLTELTKVSEAQAKSVQHAIEGLVEEERSKEALLSDLEWLKAEVEKLSMVRQDLRQKIASMVQRELARKSFVHRLLGQLRESEVTAASRAMTAKRLHAALEEGLRRAAQVQTTFFQKQIGSLQRQLDAAQKSGATKKGP